MLFMDLSIYDVIAYPSAFYVLLRYNMSMPLIAHIVTRYMRFWFFHN